MEDFYGRFDYESLTFIHDLVFEVGLHTGIVIRG